jgi:hypothetical protein
MNFKIMPELDWSWGYPAALVPDGARRGWAYLFFGGRSGCEPVAAGPAFPRKSSDTLPSSAAG